MGRHGPARDRSRRARTNEVARVPSRPGDNLVFEAGTSTVRVTATLAPGVATGTLRELGLFGGEASARPGSGTLVNHLVHDRIDKTDPIPDRMITDRIPVPVDPDDR